jgi:acyl carrier protein
MNTLPDDIVRHALARYLCTPAEVILPELHLRADLGLDPLDVVLVVLRLERMVGREFPMALLEIIHTVDELNRLVRAWASSGNAWGAIA